MIRTSFLVIAIALGTLGRVTGQELTAQDTAAGAPTPPAAAAAPVAVATSGSKTLTVKKAPFKIEVGVSGALEAERMVPVLYLLEAWTGLTVIDSVPHGSRVKAGDKLITFDMDGIDDAILQAESSQHLAELALQIAREDYAAIEASFPFEMEAVERTKQYADSDFKYFMEVELPSFITMAQMQHKSSEYSLMSSEEELKQLQKMYDADDVTEESEEIILKRAKFDAEQSRYFFEQSTKSTDREIAVQIPRREIAAKESARQAELTYRRGKISLPADLKKSKINLQMQEHNFKQGEIRLAKLRKDRETMNAGSPDDGVLYYGQCFNGRFNAQGAVAGRYPRGTPLMPGAIVMTIVKPGPLVVRSGIAEKDVRHVQAGLTGTAIPTAFSDFKAVANVTSVMDIPSADGTFETIITVDPKDRKLVAGMTCAITLTAYDKPDAITVPPSAVFSDNGVEYFVYRQGADGSHQKTAVTTGMRSDDKVEVTQGLLEGDTILLERP